MTVDLASLLGKFSVALETSMEPVSTPIDTLQQLLLGDVFTFLPEEEEEEGTRAESGEAGDSTRGSSVPGSFLRDGGWEVCLDRETGVFVEEGAPSGREMVCRQIDGTQKASLPHSVPQAAVNLAVEELSAGLRDPPPAKHFSPAYFSSLFTDELGTCPGSNSSSLFSVPEEEPMSPLEAPPATTEPCHTYSPTQVSSNNLCSELLRLSSDTSTKLSLSSSAFLDARHSSSSGRIASSHQGWSSPTLTTCKPPQLQLSRVFLATATRSMSFQKAQCFKTRQCRFWLDGRCTRGDECTFAHCGTELREKPNLRKTKICAKWKAGLCAKQQHQCTYAHGLEDLRVLPSAGLSPISGA